MTAVTQSAAATRVRVRPLTPDDRDLIARVFDGLSPRSRLLGFLAPMPHLPRRTLDALAAVDGSRHAAWVALSGNEPVGVVRCVCDAADPRCAEIAIEVVNAHQGRALTDVAMKAAAAALARLYGAHPRYEDGC